MIMINQKLNYLIVILVIYSIFSCRNRWVNFDMYISKLFSKYISNYTSMYTCIHAYSALCIHIVYVVYVRHVQCTFDSVLIIYQRTG